jgi:hypothetical protein
MNFFKATASLFYSLSSLDKTIHFVDTQRIPVDGLTNVEKKARQDDDT